MSKGEATCQSRPAMTLSAQPGETPGRIPTEQALEAMCSHPDLAGLPLRCRGVDAVEDVADAGFEAVAADGTVAATGNVTFGIPRENGPLLAHFENLQVDEAFRRRGFARALLAHLERHLERMGARSLTVAAEDEGRLAWARLGFEFDTDVYRDQFDAYGDTDDLVRVGIDVDEARRLIAAHLVSEVAGPDVPAGLFDGAASPADILAAGPAGRNVLLAHDCWWGVKQLGR